LSAGTRRNGSSRFGPFTPAPGHRGSTASPRPVPAGHAHDAYPAYDEDAAAPSEPGFPGQHTGRQTAQRAPRYSGRHATPRKTARIRARQAVPAAVVAAAFAAGAAAYTLAGPGQPQASQLNAAMSMPLVLNGAAHTGTGRADTAASAMIQATKSPGAAQHKVTASRTASPTAAASRTAASHTAAAAASPPASATPTGSASSSAPAATTLSCNLSYGLLPANVTSIVSFLLAHGYTGNAAAGIAGNIYQESKGYPESVGMGGGGLIGWTPLPSGFITGDPTADLQTQLAAILAYNQQWSSYLPALNSAASPSDAAYIYVTDFERAGIPAASTREASAEDVATACGI
jgi:hypothetical protein